MDLLNAITGNRVNYGMNTMGGVRRDVSPEQLQAILKGVDTLEERTKYYIQIATEETTLIQRLSGVGKLSRKRDPPRRHRPTAARPASRATCARRSYAAYPDVEFNVISVDNCDVYGRTLVGSAS